MQADVCLDKELENSKQNATVHIRLPGTQNITVHTKCFWQVKHPLLTTRDNTHNSVTMYVNVVVVTFSSHARILGECLTIHSLPALFFLFSGD